jgi:ATP-dependent DNA helicase RecQ
LRSDVQDHFLSGKTRILVATNAFGMGIDKPNVRAVIHFDIPGSMEAYYQEAGRAGRDGGDARCILLFNHADVSTQEFLIRNSSGSNFLNQQSLLKKLMRYAYSSDCRQRVILHYFGDPEVDRFERCGNCDNCTTAGSHVSSNTATLITVDEWTAIAARQTLSAISRLDGRFGKGRVSELLKGSEASAFLASGLHRRYPLYYGLLSDWKLQEIRDFIERLIAGKFIAVSGLEYPVLELTEQGRLALSGEVPVLLPGR